MKKRIILHVGMHKTGTTFLQRDVFPNIQGIYYAHRDPITKLIKRFYIENPVCMELESEKQTVWDYLDSRPEETVLISAEALFGLYYHSYHNNRLYADLLKFFFPDAQIFIGIRKQDDWYESLYHQLLHEGKSLSIGEFLNYQDGDFIQYRPHYSTYGTMDVRINPYPFIQNYRQLFGADNVLVLPYEFLKNDQIGFLSHLYQHYNIEPFYPSASPPYQNRSYSLISSHIALHLNKVLKREEHRKKLRKLLQKTLDPVFYIPGKFIDKKKRSKIMALHTEMNQAISNSIGFDLSQYGYH